MTRFLQNAGKYRNPINIQSQTLIENEYGEKVPVWSNVYSTRAGVFPISGKEFISSERISGQVTHKVELRYLPNVSKDMRISFNNRIFQIISVINFQEINKELQLMCSEII